MDLRALKRLSGSHSPSIESLRETLPDLEIKIDACFLSNPYATDLFLKHMNTDLLEKGGLRDVLEFYPPQNNEVSMHISRAINVERERIFACNGAIEAITAVLQNFVEESICVIIPTFSSYYEFVKPNCKVYFYELGKESEFTLNVDSYLDFVRNNKIRNVVLINPNNPNGGYISSNEIIFLLDSLADLDCVILDESFIHFAYESADLDLVGLDRLSSMYPNLVLIKSMSKDFGIAGLRAGYAIMSPERVSSLLARSYLWNISGLTNYFFKVYSKEEFRKQYEVVRKKYILNTSYFADELNSINGIKLYPSKANFFLIEIYEKTSYELTFQLLERFGIYVRDCSDKIGLNGEFIRVASRSFEENLIITQSLRECLE